jgi:hypothetical protein
MDAEARQCYLILVMWAFESWLVPRQWWNSLSSALLQLGFVFCHADLEPIAEVTFPSPSLTP